MHPLRKLRNPVTPPASLRELLAGGRIQPGPILAYGRSRGVKSSRFSLNRVLRVVPAPIRPSSNSDERTTFLRWVGTMDGHKIESMEVIVDNEQGLIVERTIALRPFPAVKLFRDAMYAALRDKLPPDVWDYPTPERRQGLFGR